MNLIFRAKLILSISFLIHSQILGQNLVPNPSFEEYVECPDGKAQTIQVVDWNNPTNATPDYFNSCSNEFAGVPMNLFGNQMARSGEAYCGITMSNLDPGGNRYREYIQCELNSTLLSNELYVIEYFVSLAEVALIACDMIGAYISEEAIEMPNDGVEFNYTPQVMSTQGIAIVDKETWIQVRDTIRAEGGERFVTIGVFASNEDLTVVEVEGESFSSPYYYIDDISVRHLILPHAGESINQDFTLYPNPVYGDELHLTKNKEWMVIRIYALDGSLTKRWVNDGQAQDNFYISNLTAGEYIMLFIARDGSCSKLRFTKVN